MVSLYTNIGTLYSYLPTAKGLLVVGDKLQCTRATLNSPCSNVHSLVTKIHFVPSHLSSRAIAISGAASLNNAAGKVYDWGEILIHAMNAFVDRAMDLATLQEIKSILQKQLMVLQNAGNTIDYFGVYIFDAADTKISSIGKFGLGIAPMPPHETLFFPGVLEQFLSYTLDEISVPPQYLANDEAYKICEAQYYSDLVQVPGFSMNLQKKISEVSPRKSKQTLEGIIEVVGKHSPYPTAFGQICIGGMESVFLAFPKCVFFKSIWDKLRR